MGLALALALLALAARPSPVASGPRPALPLGEGLADPWLAPSAMADGRFATLPYPALDGRTGNWLVADANLPLQVVVERQIADRFGLEPVVEALSAWNDVPGSRFEVQVTGTVDTGADRKRRDGISRVFLDRVDCDGDDLAHAHLHPGQVVERHGQVTHWIREADIGICERMSDQRLASVLRHEVAHVAGLGHLCDPGQECWVPAMGQDNRCRLMFPTAYPCQERSIGDELGLIHLYPRLPRIPTHEPQVGPATAARVLFPRNRSADRAVLVHEDDGQRLHIEAAQLAALRGAVLLVVDDDCTQGVGGAELNRALAVNADVTLVGGFDDTCADMLRYGWDLEVQRLADADELLDAIVAELDEPRTAYVVADVPGAHADAAAALPAAMQQGAPLLRAGPGGLVDSAHRVLDEHDSIRRVVIVGSAVHTNRQVESDLVDRRLRYRRIDHGDRAMTAIAVWLQPGLFDEQPGDVVLTSTRAATLTTAAALAAAMRVPIVFSPPTALDGRVQATLAGSASGGFVVGHDDVLSAEVQIRASRAVDR